MPEQDGRQLVDPQSHPSPLRWTEGMENYPALNAMPGLVTRPGRVTAAAVLTLVVSGLGVLGLAFLTQLSIRNEADLALYCTSYLSEELQTACQDERVNQTVVWIVLALGAVVCSLMVFAAIWALIGRGWKLLAGVTMAGIVLDLGYWVFEDFAAEARPSAFRLISVLILWLVLGASSREWFSAKRIQRDAGTPGRESYDGSAR